MNELRLKYPVRMMRRIMNVSASGYYAWVDRPLSKRAQEEVRLELEIMAAHQRNRQTYGPERLQRDLAEHGVRVGVCRIKRIRQKLGKKWLRKSEQGDKWNRCLIEGMIVLSETGARDEQTTPP